MTDLRVNSYNRKIPDTEIHVSPPLRSRSPKRGRLFSSAACLLATFCGAQPAFPKCCLGYEVTFEIPWAAGTFPTSINTSGTIAGYYTAAYSSPQGFVRDPDGTITTFTISGSPCFLTAIMMYTNCPSVIINDAGVVTGSYQDAGGVHGFVGDPKQGTITSFDSPENSFTWATGIDASSLITGISEYQNGVGSHHGFVRYNNGVIVLFDFPGAAETLPTSISRGFIAGIYFDAYHNTHGFYCLLNCIYPFPPFAVSFDPPAGLAMTPVLINSSLATTSAQVDGSAFVRNLNGNIASFDAPGSSRLFTTPWGIDGSGDIVGSYYDSNNLSHAFFRQADGYFPFGPNADPAGSVCAQATGINDSGIFIGWYSKTGECQPAFSGFLSVP